MAELCLACLETLQTAGTCVPRGEHDHGDVVAAGAAAQAAR